MDHRFCYDKAMTKAAPVEKIEDIEKKNLGYWVMVAVTKIDRYKTATHGRLLARSKHRDPLHKKARNFFSDPAYAGTHWYMGYGAKPMNRDYCLYHRVVD